MFESKSFTALIVDDAEELREAIVFEFENEGFHVFEAKSGNEAFDFIKSGNNIDVIISDIKMPDGSGIDLLNKLRKFHFKNPPLIFISAYSEVAIEDVYNLGAVDMFPKPFDSDKLLLKAKNAALFKDSMLLKGDVDSQNLNELSLKFKSISISSDKNDPNDVLLGRGGVFVPFTKDFPVLDCNINLSLDLEEGKFRDFKCIINPIWIRENASDKLQSGFGAKFIKMDKNQAEYIQKITDKNKVISFIPNGQF